GEGVAVAAEVAVGRAIPQEVGEVGAPLLGRPLAVGARVGLGVPDVPDPGEVVVGDDAPGVGVAVVVRPLVGRARPRLGVREDDGADAVALLDVEGVHRRGEAGVGILGGDLGGRHLEGEAA
ncbi:MAG: hypothetical protein ACK559_06560, partial [bacterium]